MKGKREQGFTLIELIVALAILGFLLAIAVPNYMAVQERSQISAMDANCEMHKDLVLLVRAEDDPTRFYEPNAADGNTSLPEHDASLSGCIENEIEIDNEEDDDTDNETTWRFINPYSGKDGVINWYNPTGLGSTYHNRSVLLTNDDKFDPEGGLSLGTWKGAAGLVVGYFDEDTNHILIYWIDKEGQASAKQIDMDMSTYY